MISHTKFSNRDIQQRLTGGSHEISSNSNAHILPHQGCLTCEMNKLIGGGCLTCMGGSSVEDMIKNKPIEGLTTRKINDILNIVRQNEKQSVIFGSYAYAPQYFPSDIDMRSIISGCCSPEQIYKATQEILKQISKNLNYKRGIYLGEIKVGNDKRFMLKIDDPDFINKVKNLYNSGLLDDDEIDYIIELHNKNDQNSKDELSELIRMLYVLRWSREEIKKGVKVMKGNKKITLLEAIKQGTQIKIDLWATVQGRYIEVSNFFYMVLFDKNKNIFKILNVSPEKLNSNYIKEMKFEVKKLQKPVFQNYFKMAKRMWLVARAIQDKNLLEKLTPLFQGSIARLSQIKTDIETILLIINGVKNPPYQTLMEQIDNFKTRLSYINDLDFDFDKAYELLDNILNNYKKNTYRFTKKVLELTKSNLKKLQEYSKEVIKKYTLEYLKNKGLFPVPNSFFSIPDSPSTEGEYIRSMYNKMFDENINYNLVPIDGSKNNEPIKKVGFVIPEKRLIGKGMRRNSKQKNVSDGEILKLAIGSLMDAAQKKDSDDFWAVLKIIRNNGLLTESVIKTIITNVERVAPGFIMANV